MVLLVLILLISTGDGSGSRVSAVIQQSFSGYQRGMNDAGGECETIKKQLESAYGNQVISSKCIRSR